MLDRILRHGVRSTSSTASVCWRCLLERQYPQRSIHNHISRRSKSSASHPNPEAKVEAKSSALKSPAPVEKPAKSKDATKLAGKAKIAKTDGKSTERSHKRSRRRRGESKIRKLASVSSVSSVEKSKPSSTLKMRARVAHEQVIVAKDMPGWGEHSGRVKNASSDAGRLRMRRRMASLKKDPTSTELDDQDTAGASIEEAMSGTTIADAGKQDGGVSAEFMTRDLEIKVVNKELGPVPRLAHGLQRALFNRGVLQFRDLHSRVYNFDPALEMLPPADKVDFDSLSQFTPPSRDKVLAQIAQETGKKYIGSTSSLTGLLKHFHFLLSNFRPLNFSMLSHLNESPWKFTKITQCPDAIMLRYRDGIYSCDADKEFDGPNVLSLMGRYLEKYLTSGKETFEKYKVGNKHLITEEDAEPEAFHYSTVDDFLMRSQLDAYDPRLPGTGIFDLKTRAVLPIRMDTQDFEWGMDYEINRREGKELSFEREFADMARATMLKYSLQVRIGRMDGIFVAYHNIARIFGFQYISLNEMDFTIHGQQDCCLGDQEFVASMHLLNELVNRATEKFPKQSLRIHVETPDTTKENALYFFAEPVTDAQIDAIQNGSKTKTAEWEAELLGLNDIPDQATVKSTDIASESSFITLASETDRFRARIRRIQDGRINPILEAGGATSDPQSPLSSNAQQKQQPPDDQAATIIADATLLAADSESGTTEADSSTSESAESGLASTVNDMDDMAEIVPNPSDTTVNTEMEIHTAVDLDNVPKSDELVEDLVNDVLPVPEHEAITDATTDPAIDLLAETTDELSASLAKSNLTHARKVMTESRLPLHSKSQPHNQKAKAEEEDVKPQGPLIALILKTRSTVNDKACAAPKDLKPSDRWKISHSITEVSTPRRAWTLYESTKRRRRALMHDKKVERAMSNEKDWFRDNLKQVTLDARDWREEQERKDRKKEEKDKGVWVWDRETPVKRGEYVSRY